MKRAALRVGDRVAFAQGADDFGTVARIIRSNRCPSWPPDTLTLTRQVTWYLVTWDEPARPGESDPETWWQYSDLTPAGAK